MSIFPIRAAASCLVGTAIAACGHGVEQSDCLGLVLSGGGAKGAYEVGVWQELRASGLASRVTAVSGTSIGAINAALFASRPEAAESIWLENMQGVFAVNTNAVGRSLQKLVDVASNSVEVAEKTGDNAKAVGHFVLSAIVQAVSGYVDATETDSEREGYVDSSRLGNAIDANLPAKWPTNAPMVYVTALVKGGEKECRTWCINAEQPERRTLMIRASAAIPGAFDTIGIDGKTYIDGGWEGKGGDNTPLSPILDNHPNVKTVIVVYLKDKKHINAVRRAENRKAANEKNVRLVEIIPSEDIDGKLQLGVFNTSPETIRHLIKLGRDDMRKALIFWRRDSQ